MEKKEKKDWRKETMFWRDYKEKLVIKKLVLKLEEYGDYPEIEEKQR